MRNPGARALCPREESNLQLTGFESGTSTNWVTGTWAVKKKISTGCAAGGSRTLNIQALDLTPLPVGLPRQLFRGLSQPWWDGKESNLHAEATELQAAGLTTCPTAPGAELDRSGCALFRRAGLSECRVTNRGDIDAQP